MTAWILACALLVGPARAADKGGARPLTFSVYKGGRKFPFTDSVNKLDAKAIGEMGKRRWGKAVELFDQSLKFMPDNPRALANRGVCLDELGESDRAVKDFTRALDLFPELKEPLGPSYARALLHRGRKLVDQGENGAAVQDFQASARVDPTSPAPLSEIAYLAYQSGQYPSCVSYAEKAIKLDPAFPDSYGNRGACRFASGEREQALADLDEAVRLDPKRASFYASRAGVLFNMGRKNEAAADAKKAVALDPSLAQPMRPILGENK